jgi:hypothetical protein
MKAAAPLEAPWRSGVAAARANVKPALFLQAVALALVLGYYRVPRVHAALGAVAAFRGQVGLPFAMVSTAFFAGVLPFPYLHYAVRDRDGRPHYTWGQGFGLVVFWAYKGIEVGLWYALQARVFGTGHDVGTIAVKTFMDQFVYCPILAVPLTALVYHWVDSGYDGRALVADLRTPRWYRRRTLPVLIGNLGVWLPAVAIVYALPTPLQLPLQNIVLCFYTLIVAHQTKTHPPVPATG